jgi:hypothetical protein
MIDNHGGIKRSGSERRKDENQDGALYKTMKFCREAVEVCLEKADATIKACQEKTRDETKGGLEEMKAA